ncbi:MAG TPA: SRPBCC family protein, partial [Mycobacterium sp.]|uniref:SRPBCC family protein n=1 Tax=Mycobacterium sp. TaxID=1785 RepID=UPI002D3CFE47
MRVQRRIIVNADRDTVWKVLSEPDRYPSFLPHLERWETLTEGPARVGARYTVHWKIGSVPVGGLIEVVEFDDGRDLAFVGLTGITLR